MPEPRKSQHIDEMLEGWAYDPSSISVRMVRGADNRELVQMRIEMGLLQLETSGRPDGERPFGCNTMLDHIIELALSEGDDFIMDEEQCTEADREFVQFYHRRICWLALREFRRAVRDADHTLELMNVCRDYSPDEHWTLSHEQYRPFVLFHRTQAASLAELDEEGPVSAIETVNEGIRRLRAVYDELTTEEEFEDDELVQRLTELRESLREQFDVGRTLQEQLCDAVHAEKYELAAQLRDQLALTRKTASKGKT